MTTDHGEEFNDSGDNYWGHGSDFTRYQTQVPCVLHLPGVAPRVIDKVTSHLDLAPTLLKNYLGCRNDVRDYSDGVDLLGEIPDRRPLVIASYFNHAVILGDDVFATLPMQVKKYKVYDSTLPAGPPAMDLMREALAGMARFYGKAPARKAGAADAPARVWNTRSDSLRSHPASPPPADAAAAP